MKSSEQASFFWDDRFEGSHALVYLKNEHFPINLLRNTIYVCWNPQHRVHFSEMIHFKGSHTLVYLKNECFPSISLEMPEMSVVTIRTGLVFPRWSIWGDTCLGLLEKWMFSHLSPLKCHKCVLKPSAQGSFVWDDWFEGSHA